jgi:hypothetical protein
MQALYASFQHTVLSTVLHTLPHNLLHTGRRQPEISGPGRNALQPAATRAAHRPHVHGV